MAEGALPPSRSAPEALAGWLSRYSDAIHDDAQPQAWQFYGPTTRKGSACSCTC
jgi:hypothetical protein